VGFIVHKVRPRNQKFFFGGVGFKSSSVLSYHIEKLREKVLKSHGICFKVIAHDDSNCSSENKIN
jgi:hypothetical protein